jgi:hypothetical protein
VVGHVEEPVLRARKAQITVPAKERPRGKGFESRGGSPNGRRRWRGRRGTRRADHRSRPSLTLLRRKLKRMPLLLISSRAACLPGRVAFVGWAENCTGFGYLPVSICYTPAGPYPLSHLFCFVSSVRCLVSAILQGKVYLPAQRPSAEEERLARVKGGGGLLVEESGHHSQYDEAVGHRLTGQHRRSRRWSGGRVRHVTAVQWGCVLT